jgi:hypothetical protein
MEVSGGTNLANNHLMAEEMPMVVEFGIDCCKGPPSGDNGYFPAAGGGIKNRRGEMSSRGDELWW